MHEIKSFHQPPLHQDCQLHPLKKKTNPLCFFPLHSCTQKDHTQLISILAFKMNQNSHTLILKKDTEIAKLSS